jgi:hypothetical protein
VVFSGTTGFSNNETDHYDITEILLEVVFNTITSFFLLTFEDKTRNVFFVGLAADWWCSAGTPVSPTNKTDRYDIEGYN